MCDTHVLVGCHLLILGGSRLRQLLGLGVGWMRLCDVGRLLLHRLRVLLLCSRGCQTEHTVIRIDSASASCILAHEIAS